ncbi:MAG: chemotaxis protein CheW [Melioribacteraceae bacterium]|nr:chemotaxis protein CheW [Melioribacteraceae bacterium]MCF8354005.1 chemotaxis protein CheW [Melioribacteraceae bacterium]MCF8392314.1 chemotaxis protein CheW [Melioribacteraceae bacterium]MCF8417646.1 chemotaxis protein CheW [Melioribacteraceae bacterium]
MKKIEKEIESKKNCWTSIGVWGDSSCKELEKFIHCRNCPVFSDAGLNLFEQEHPSGYIDEWTNVISKEKDISLVDEQTFLVFRLGDEWFGISSKFIFEIMELKTVHSLPQTKDIIIKGIVNVRGEIKIAISLHDLFTIEEQKSKKEKTKKIYKRMIAITKDKNIWVFPVDEIYGIFKLGNKTLSDPPSTAKNSSVNFIKGVYDAETFRIGYIDEQKLFATIIKRVYS